MDESLRLKVELVVYRPSSLCMGNWSQSYGALPAIWDHAVLPATRHRWTRSTSIPARQAARFTYLGVDLGVGIYTRLYLHGWLSADR